MRLLVKKLHPDARLDAPRPGDVGYEGGNTPARGARTVLEQGDYPNGNQHV